MDPVSKLLCLLEVGELALHPDGVAVRSVGDSPVDRTIASTLQPIVTLPGPRAIPIEEDVGADDASSDCPGIGVALALGLGKIPRDKALLVGAGARVDSGDDGVIETHEAGLGQPVVLNGLQLGPALPGLFGRHHEIVQGLEAGLGASEDKGVVSGVDGGGNESSGLSIGSGNGHEIGTCVQTSSAFVSLLYLACRFLLQNVTQLTHYISLGADGNQAVDVLLNRDENLSGHVTALLGAGSLIFDVDTGGSLLNEELGELHDSGETTMASVRIGDDGPKVINVRNLAALGLWGCETLLALFAVMEELCVEQVADFVGDGSLWRSSIAR